MRPQTRDRLLLPILLPVGILVVIAGVLFGFSRILLNVSHTAATATALVVAAGIVVIAAVAASRPQVRGSTVAATAGATAGVAMLTGGIALAVLAGGGEGGEEPGGEPGAVVALSAQDIAFQPDALTAPAGEPFTIAFDNRDAGVQHNVDIFTDDSFSGTPLFEGELVTGVATANYEVDALDAGTYAFRCVVHPQMVGTLQVEEGGGGGPGEGGVSISAANLEFDTDEIRLPADAPSTIAFDNRDAGVQHNVAIYSDESLGELLFKGDLVTGPETIDYDVPPIPAGEYYFHCDVHPTMNGTVIADGGGEPGSTGATGGEATGATGGGGPSGEPGGGSTGPPGGGGTAEPSTVAASGLAFDTGSISLPTDGATLTFDNQDAGVQHNIAIYTDDTLATNLFRGELVTGPGTSDYSIPPIDAGEYYFHCDVHPSMNGSVTVG